VGKKKNNRIRKQISGPGNSRKEGKHNKSTNNKNTAEQPTGRATRTGEKKKDRGKIAYDYGDKTLEAKRTALKQRTKGRGGRMQKRTRGLFKGDWREPATGNKSLQRTI